MENVIELGRHKVFTLEEAQSVVSIINKITRGYSQQVDSLIRQMDALGTGHEEKVIKLEQQVNELVEQWQQKIEKLGGLTRGLWLADFDSGKGYYCWKYPEDKIEYFHSYSDGFSGRVRLNCTEEHKFITQEHAEIATEPTVGL
jgi:hypothetical protein